MLLKRIAEPSDDCVSLTQVRTYLGLGDDTSWDDVLEILTEAATQDVEDFLRRPLMSSSHRVTVDRDELGIPDNWENDYAAAFDIALDIPLAMVSAVTAVRVYDDEGTATTLTTLTDYKVDLRDDDATLYLKSSAIVTSTLRRRECLEIEVTAGYGDGVPAKFVRLVLSLIAYDFDHRGDAPDPEARRTVLNAGNADRVIRL